MRHPVTETPNEPADVPVVDPPTPIDLPPEEPIVVGPPPDDDPYTPPPRPVYPDDPPEE